MTEVVTLLDYALRYAALGWPVVPLHTPNDEGVCDCPDHADCGKNTGKHPRTMNGVKDATTDEAKIRIWWTISYPLANIGIDLARAGLVDIAPDSVEWLDEFKRRGLPETLSFASGGGDGHEHHLYARSESCPTYRLTETGKYDIMSAGYPVMPPSRHRLGPTYTWRNPADLAQLIAPPVAPVPGWAKEMLLEKARRPRTGNGVAHHVYDADEPPVRLRGDALERWHGRVFHINPQTGDIDRSWSLWQIVVDLRDAGATYQTARGCLPGRDVALDWRAFIDRGDADERYDIIAMKAYEGQGSQRIHLNGHQNGSSARAAAEPGVPEFKLRLWPNLELASRVAVETAWYARGLVGPGLMTELDGWAKLSGKTTFALALIRSLLGGRDFLGLSTTSTGVVYLTEQTWQSLMPNIRKAGLVDAERLYWAFYNEAYGAPWADVIDSAIKQARADDCGLLVVDTLAQWSGLKGDIENNSGTAYQILAALQPAIAAGLAVLILRHDKKAGGEVTLSARGSGAYAAVMDVVLHLQPVPGGSSKSRQRLLTGSGRFADETPSAAVIELSASAPFEYTSLGDPDVVMASTTDARVWSALPAEEAFAVSTEMVAEYTGIRREDVVKSLHKMVLDTRVLRKGPGLSGKPFLFWRRSLEVSNDD